MPAWLLSLIENNPALISSVVPALLRSLADQIEKDPNALKSILATFGVKV